MTHQRFKDATPKERAKKTLEIAAYSVIAVAWAIAGFVLYLVIFPVQSGTSIENIELPEVVYAGETVTAKIEYCKTVSGKVESTYSLNTVDQVYYFDPVISNRPLGCDIVGFEVKIPDSAPEGPATYELDVFREYNVLNQETISAKSNEFEIKNDDAQ